MVTVNGTNERIASHCINIFIQFVSPKSYAGACICFRCAIYSCFHRHRMRLWDVVQRSYHLFAECLQNCGQLLLQGKIYKQQKSTTKIGEKIRECKTQNILFFSKKSPNGNGNSLIRVRYSCMQLARCSSVGTWKRGKTRKST